MKKFLFLLFFIGVIIFSPNSALSNESTTATHGSTCTVKSNDSAAGLVYVNCASSSRSTLGQYTHTQPPGPKDEDYKEEMTSICEGPGGDTTVEQVYYLYAKPEPGYKFVEWRGSQSSTDNPFTMTVSHSTKLPNHNPYTVTAYFIADNAVNTETNVPVGRITLEPEAPQIGSQVKATAKVIGLSQNNSLPTKNMMIVFDHWEKSVDGKCVDSNFGTDETIEFDVDEVMTLTAVFKNLGGLPEKGKYYRVRNVYNRVLSVEGGYKVNIPASGTDIDDTLLRWALTNDHNYDDFPTSKNNHDWDEYESDNKIWAESSPNTIFYMEDGGKSGDKFKNGILSSQGINTNTITGQNLDVEPVDEQYYGYYGVVASAAGGAGFQAMPRPADTDKNLPARCVVNVSQFKSASIYCALAIQPIDEEHIDYFWFGANADDDMLFEEGYWTTMYAAFPYKIYDEDGVEAYYVTTETQKANGVTYLVLNKIEDGIIPAESAVLLKCKEPNNTKSCRFLPLSPDDTSVKGKSLNGNILKGEYQLYDKDKKGRIQFNSNTMRVLGVNQDGIVGFYKLSDGTELKANKAYLDLNELPAEMRNSSFRLVSKDSTTGIDSFEEDGSSVHIENNTIYDISGNKVSHPQTGTIYIINGKKVIWK